MNPPDPPAAQYRFSPLDAARDFLRALDVIHLYIHHADAEADAWVHILQRLQILRGPMRQLEHQMVRLQPVQEADESAPLAFLNRLAPVIAKTQVNGPLAIERSEHPINRRRRDFGVGRSAWNICLVNLQAGAWQ